MLTDAKLKSLKPNERAYKVVDRDGLYVSVSPAGGISFDWAEIRAAYMRSKAGPPATPTLNEVLRLIAGFGGFLARKGDGKPGVQTLWKGLRKIRIAPEALRAADDSYR